MDLVLRRNDRILKYVRSATFVNVDRRVALVDVKEHFVKIAKVDIRLASLTTDTGLDPKTRHTTDVEALVADSVKDRLEPGLRGEPKDQPRVVVHDSPALLDGAFKESFVLILRNLSVASVQAHLDVVFNFWQVNAIRRVDFHDVHDACRHLLNQFKKDLEEGILHWNIDHVETIDEPYTGKFSDFSIAF